MHPSNFRLALIEAIKGTNDGYAEDGMYMAVNLIELVDSHLNTISLIQFINLTDQAKIKTYHLDWNNIIDPYMEAYEADGGDEEYESIEHWMVTEQLFANNCEKVTGSK